MIRTATQLLITCLFLSSCNKNSSTDSISAVVKTDVYCNLPTYSKVWFDSLITRQYKSQYLKVYSSNGLSESFLINYNDWPQSVAEINGVYYRMEQHWFSYSSSIYNHKFSFGKKFNKYTFNDTLINGVKTQQFFGINPCLGLIWDDAYILEKLFSDSSNNIVTLEDKILNGWFPIGKLTVLGSTYNDVYQIKSPSGNYLSFYIDKHFGIIQFQTTDSIIWSIQL